MNAKPTARDAYLARTATIRAKLERLTSASHRSMAHNERQLTAQGASPSTNRVSCSSRDETGRSVSETATATIRFRPRDDSGVGLANLRFDARQFCSCKHASKPLPVARAQVFDEQRRLRVPPRKSWWIF